MTAQYWIFLTGIGVMTACAPWAEESAIHSWVNAYCWGMSAYCALQTIALLLKTASGEQK